MNAAAVLLWVRDRTPHAPAHFLTRWHNSQAVFMCGNWAARGGQVLSWAEAKELQTHVCRGCVRTVYGTTSTEQRSVR